MSARVELAIVGAVLAALLAVGLLFSGTAGAQTVTPTGPKFSGAGSIGAEGRAAVADLVSDVRRGGPGYYGSSQPLSMDVGGSYNAERAQKLAGVGRRLEQAGTAQGASDARAGAFRQALNAGRTSTASLPKLALGRAIPIAGAFATGWQIGSYGRQLYITATLPEATGGGWAYVYGCEQIPFGPGPDLRGCPRRADGTLDLSAGLWNGSYTLSDGRKDTRDYWSPDNTSQRCNDSARPAGDPAGGRRVSVGGQICDGGQPKESYAFQVPGRAFRHQPLRESKPDGWDEMSGAGGTKALTMPQPKTDEGFQEALEEFWDSEDGQPLRENWPWIEEQTDDTSYDPQTDELDVTESPSGTEPKVRIPAPQTGETAAAYLQRLQELGLAGSIRQRASGDADPTVGPDGITKVTPSPGGKVATGSAVEVETNPSDAPEPGTGSEGEPGTVGGGSAAPSCGLTAPAARVDLSPLSRLDAGGRFPLSLLPWITGQVGGLAGDREPPEFRLSVWGQSAESRDWWGLVDPIFSVLRVLFAVALWVGVAWWLYERTLGAQTA